MSSLTERSALGAGLVAADALPGVLVVGQSLYESLLSGLSSPAPECLVAQDWPGAREQLARQWVGVLVVDTQVPLSPGWVQELTQRWPDVRGLLVLDEASEGESEHAAAMVRGGDSDVALPEAFQRLFRQHLPWTLVRAVEHAQQHYWLERETRRLRAEQALSQPVVQARLAAHRQQLQQSRGFERIIRLPGSPLDGLCHLAARIAGFDVPVLVTGESGTGKELMARAIHSASLRSEMPFLALDCGAVSDELLESELFGHCKGAFTGASAHRIGMLERAQQGTLLLDEVGDASPAFQLRLLRFLQEGEIRPVGTNTVRQLDVRVIAATHRDLAAEVAAGRFREDLYHRLNVATVALPALRERPEDIPSLAEALLMQLASRHGVRVSGFGPGVLDCLSAQPWSGNVRELENQITRMLMMTTGATIGLELLPEALRTPPHAGMFREEQCSEEPGREERGREGWGREGWGCEGWGCEGWGCEERNKGPVRREAGGAARSEVRSEIRAEETDGGLGAVPGEPCVRDSHRQSHPASTTAPAATLREQIELLETRCLLEALTRHAGNKTRAAEELGLSRIGLRAKLKRYGIDYGIEGGDAAGPSDAQ
ncbi:MULTISPECIES: sigma-54 dependent transcriptional regulator [unclassified Halomonas]|uniref:sigma-54 dependent transcriptional regulator n=1 Tax=unclassified Halomonas TaxID=2609666 RepID=UPI001C96839E|nr:MULTISPECIES: sigma-54 dependent transcriptional regulator [unclassified Halomonas]MBY5926175.1 sigma-54 dependent transcriptional regulator [Halomonas sp. DP4Y7-2]MBY6233217.1 sigma-54 dependent transcriptional regulator [Halomonas sp. DP4Y7-1]